MSAARQFVEVVQGPAAEARFAYADDPQNAAIEIANGLDISRLPSKRAIEAARDERRRSSRLYPQGIDQMVVPGWRLRSAPPPRQDKAGLSPQLDDLLRDGMELLEELSAPVTPERTKGGGWSIEGGLPDGWWEKVDAFEQRIRDLLHAEHPALLQAFAEGHNGYLRKQRESSAVEDKPDPKDDKRSTAEKMLDFANFSRSGPARKTEAILEGLAAARLELGEEGGS